MTRSFFVTFVIVPLSKSMSISSPSAIFWLAYFAFKDSKPNMCLALRWISRKALGR